MGVDGYSIANTGININKTSSTLSSEAEILARQGNEVQIKDIDGLSKKAKTARKDREAGFNGMVYLPGQEEDAEPQEQENQGKKKQNHPKKTKEDFSNYHFRLNKQHLIEIYDSKTNEILRTITPEDAVKVLVNLADVPGFIVNKKA